MAAVFLGGSVANVVTTASKLTGAHAGRHTLTLKVPQQSRGAITTRYTAAKLFTLFWLSTMMTAHWGTLLVFLPTSTQDSWAQGYMQIRSLATLSRPQVLISLQEKGA